MKKLLLILLCLPFIGLGQGFSLRTFPVYLVPPVMGTSWGVDYHLNKNTTVDINFYPYYLLIGEGSGLLVSNLSSGYKKYNKKNYFIDYRARISRFTWNVNDDIDDDIEEKWEYLYYTLGPEINLGKRFYFTQKRKGFVDLGIGVAFNLFTLYSLQIHEKIGLREVTEYEKIDRSMRVFPNFILQFGYTFNQNKT